MPGSKDNENMANVPASLQPAYERFSLAQIEDVITKKGFWQESDEWRIFTDTIFRITPIETLNADGTPGSVVFAVQVKCDYDLRCECPTLERAIHFCEVFQKWIIAGWKEEGWPSWAEKARMKQ